MWQISHSHFIIYGERGLRPSEIDHPPFQIRSKCFILTIKRFSAFKCLECSASMRHDAFGTSLAYPMRANFQVNLVCHTFKISTIAAHGISPSLVGAKARADWAGPLLALMS